MLNRIVIMGRLTRDPELRYTPSEKPVCSFTVAVERDIPGEGGNRETDFIDCVAWNKAAEVISKYFTKGRMICVDGKLQSRKWTDKNGNNRINWEVLVERFNFCGDRTADDGERDGSYSTRPAPTGRPVPSAKQTATPRIDDFSDLEEDDDNGVPFH